MKLLIHKLRQLLLILWRSPPQLYGCCFSRVRCCSGVGFRLSGNCFSAGGFLYTRVRCSTGGCSLEASSIEWLLLLWSPLLYRKQGAVPPERSSTIVWLLLPWSPLHYRGLLIGDVLHNCVAAAPLEFAALQGAAPLEASSAIEWLLLL